VGILAALAGIAGLVGSELGMFSVANPEVLIGAVVVGGAATLFGFVYEIVRELITRRHRPAHRHRGASVLLLLFFALVLANAAAVPFFGDLFDALFGGGELSLLGQVVVFMSTQAALLSIVALFVVVPGVFPAPLPRPGASVARSALVGALVAFPAWIGTNLAVLGFAWLFQRLGVPSEPTIVEELIANANPLISAVAVVVAAPVAEEVFFRGVAFNAWLREYGLRRAYLGSGFLFGLVHQSLVVLVPFTALGMLLAWVYRRTGSLAAPIALHAVFNGTSLTIFLLERARIIDLPF
jgi:membrane protease YdiL (CAAX protease family)